MTDNFERVKTDILLRTGANGGPTPRDLLKAIEASNQDFDNGFMEIGGKLDDLTACVKAHHQWTDAVLKPELECMHKDLEAVGPDHDTKHRQHMEADHPHMHEPYREDDSGDRTHWAEREENRTTLSEIIISWTFTKKVAWVAVSAAVVFGVGIAGNAITQSTTAARDREALKQEVLDQGAAEREQLRLDLIDAIRDSNNLRAPAPEVAP